MVKHLPKIAGADSDVNPFASHCLGFCSNNWQKVLSMTFYSFACLFPYNQTMFAYNLSNSL